MERDICEILSNGSEFEKILLLDNIHSHLPNEPNRLEAIVNSLFAIASNEESYFIRLRVFRILCELNFVGSVKNWRKLNGLAFDMISESVPELVTVALRYLPSLDLTLLDSDLEAIKGLADSDDADVSGQARYFLGTLALKKEIPQQDSGDFRMARLQSLLQAAEYFRLSIEVEENRVDSEFMIHFCNWYIGLISQSAEELDEAFQKICSLFQMRSLYSVEEKELQFDSILLEILCQLHEVQKLASLSATWINFGNELNLIKKLIFRIALIQEGGWLNHSFSRTVHDAMVDEVENLIYKIELKKEESRIRRSLSEASNADGLQDFLSRLVGAFGSDDLPSGENLALYGFLERRLGESTAKKIYQTIRGGKLDNDALSIIGKALDDANGIRSSPTGFVQGAEVCRLIEEQISFFLPDYEVKKRKAFMHVFEEIVRYACKYFIGSPKKHSLLFFSKSEGGKGADLVEADLQLHLLEFLEKSKAADGILPELANFVDGGRVDIVYKRDIITVPIELKKSDHLPTWDDVDKFYIAQAQTYTAGHDQLGIFIVVELSEKRNFTPLNIRDWFSIRRIQAPEGITVNFPDFVVSLIIPGNRVLPSSKSNYGR